MGNISYDTKVNYTFKKQLNKLHTDNKKEWYEELSGIMTLSAKEVWIDEIPSNPIDGINNKIVEKVSIEMSLDKTVGGNRSWYAEKNGKRLTQFISPKFGIDYTVSIIINGQKIPTSHISKPLFDYDNGVLTFESNPPKTNKIIVNGYIYKGKILQQYIDYFNNSLAIGVLGLDEPKTSYKIIHNMNTYDLQVSIYTYDDVLLRNEIKKYWKIDSVPVALLSDSEILVQLSEPKPIRFIIKSQHYEY